MKKIIVSVLLLMAGLSQAATLVLTNSASTLASTNAITNSAGVAFTSGTAGVAAVGYFTITDTQIASITSATDLVNAFQNWNTAGTTGFVNSTAPVLAKGYFTASASARTVAGSTFENKNMYILVGNGLTYATSTEFLVLKSTVTFSAADDSVNPNVTYRFSTSNTSVVLGNTGGNVTTTATDATTNASWQTVSIVPEPSAALLGLLGVFGLARRRR